MKNTRNYTKDGLILGLGIGSVCLVAYMFYGFFTLESESLGYFKLSIPMIVIEFILFSVALGALTGWVYGKVKNKKVI